MALFSIKFIGFVCITLVVYYALNKKVPGKQWIILLLASLIFYHWTGKFSYIIITALTTWAGALLSLKIGAKYKAIKKDKTIGRAEKKVVKKHILNQRRVVLLAVMLVNFGILGYIKYWSTMWNGLMGFLQMNPGFHFGHLLLPLGISFYTFQSMGYMIDVHNDKYPPERNFFKFLLFVSFFPQLIQGPINRFDALAKQLFEPHPVLFENIRYGMLLFGFGAMKKFAIADLLNPSVAAIMDKGPGDVPGSIMLLGAFLYAIQQYADFSGGIDMVMGAARMFDIQMAPNFRQPYFSTSLGDFWRRWHITLGAWMRDYVFYPFALTDSMLHFGKWAGTHLGKHCGRVLPACVGNLVVFFLVGIWHGPELHFVLWGLYNGIIIALNDLFEPVFKAGLHFLQVNEKSKGYHLFLILLTFFIVNIAGYFDRITDVSKSFHFLVHTFTNFEVSGFGATYHSLVYPHLSDHAILVICLASIIVFINSVLQERKIDTFSRLANIHIAFRWAVYYGVIFLTMASFLIPSGAGGFMYANF